MERFSTFLAIGLLLNPLSFLPPSSVAPTIHPTEKSAPDKTEIKHNFAKIPLSFEQNIGQSGQEVKFSAKAGDVSLLLTHQSAVLKMPRQSAEKNSPSVEAMTLTMKMVGANSTPKIIGVDRQQRVTNYFKGQDQRDWITGVPNFNRVKQEEVWQGIDAVWYEHEQQLEYDFIVAPQANPKQIALEFTGAESLAIDAGGNLVLHTAAGEIVHHAPIIYQQVKGEKKSIAGKFVLCENTVRFEIGNYDRERELVIDPRIIYSSFLRGGDSNVTETHFPAATVNAAGNVFASGFGTNFLDIAQTSSSRALFVVKLNTTGTGVEYVTFLSTEGLTLDGVSGLAVDNAGNAYFTGFTSSRKYPLKNEFQSRVNPGLTIPHFIPKIDAVVTKLDPSGAIVYSTYLGGANDDKPFGIAVDSAGRACVTGYAMSANFPKQNQFQGNAIGTLKDIFVTVFEPGGNTLRYSTLLRSGSNHDEGHGIAVDSADNVYITGFAKDNNLPTRSPSSAGPFRANNSGGVDAFVAKFNPSLSGDASLIYCTYLGGTGTDQGFGIAVDSANVAYVTGITGSVNFPLQAAAGSTVIDNTNVVNEAFVTGVNSTGSALTFSTFLGGSSTEIGKSIALDSARNILVAGDTASSNFPIRNAFQLTPGGAADIFVAKLQAGGKSLMYATYLGGNDDEQLGSVAIDGRSNVYVYGDTLSHNYPVTAGALAETFTIFVSLFTTKISNVNAETIGGYNPATSVFTLRNSGTSESNITFGQPGIFR